MAAPARPEPKVFLSDELAGRGRGVVRRDLLRPRRATRRVLGEKSTSYLEYPRRPRGPRAVLGRPADPRPAARPGRAGACRTGRSAPTPGLETRSLADALARQPRGPAAVGPRAHVGLAVRLPRARSLRRLPRPVAGPLRRRRHRAVPRGDCRRDRDASADLYAWLGVDPDFRPPVAGRPRSTRARQAAPAARRRTCSARLRGVLRTSSDRALAAAAGAPAALGRRRRDHDRGGRAVTDAARDRVQQGQRRGRRARAHRARRSAAATRRPAARSRSRRGELLQDETGAAEVLLTTSCTAALEMSALLLDLQPGDTVIVPSFTFVSSALAFVRAGRRDPVLRHRAADPRPRPAPRRRAARRLGARGRGGALRRHRLRHGRPARGADGPARRRRHRGQRARALRPLARPAAGQPRPVRDPQLPRDQELRLRRGRGARAQRPRGRRPGLGALRQGHRTARRSSRARSTSTPGATPARPSGSPTRSRRTCSGSSSSARSSRRKRRARATSGTSRLLTPHAGRAGPDAADRPRGRRAGLPPVPRAAARPRDPHPGR